MRYVKKLLSFILCVTLLAGLPANGTYASESAGKAVDTAAKPPSLEAKGAILMEFDTGRVLFEKDADVPLAPASTTKIMTAILAIEKCGLSDIVVASKNASVTPPVKMYLQPGEKQTVETLLYALMLESANDAAVALAEHVSGSVEAFARLMNEKARSIGARNTEFVTPNGLDSGNHHSTARDMALIARYALNNKDFVRIINTPHVTTPVGGGDFKQHSFVNKDRLLREYDGALGVKTGYTGKAGHCFVGAAKQNGMMLISTVLASGWGNKGKEQKWIDTKKLLSYGFDNYDYVTVAKEGEMVATAEVLHSKGATAGLRLKSGLTIPISKAETGSLRMRYSLPEVLDAPLEKGQKIGSASVVINNNVVAKIDIISDNDVERHDFKISAGKILNSWLNMDYRAIYQN